MLLLVRPAGPLSLSILNLSIVNKIRGMGLVATVRLVLLHNIAAIKTFDPFHVVVLGLTRKCSVGLLSFVMSIYKVFFHHFLLWKGTFVFVEL